MDATPLAPYALRDGHARRHHPAGDAGRVFQYRNDYQRDRDRIVYSRAFRRLRQKAQTGILPDYEDHRRNRLTHTLEVAQLARTAGRALGLHEDLVEAVALGHDLGQPPFGPTGAVALDDWLSGELDGRGGPGLGDLGGFSCGEQAVWVVDRLEKRYDHDGINLTHDVREGLLKCHPYRVDRIDDDTLRPGRAAMPEVQVVAWCDRLTTTIHDLDDALQSGMIDPAKVERRPLVRELKHKVGTAWPARGSTFVRANAIHRGLTHLAATALVTHSRRRLETWWRGTGLDEGAWPAARDEHLVDGLVELPPKVEAGMADLEGFLARWVDRTQVRTQLEARARRTVLGLLAAFASDARLLPDHVLIRVRERTRRPYLRDLAPPEARIAVDRLREDPLALRTIADHVAAMTDGYALEEHRRLREMGAVPIPSMEQLARERTVRRSGTDRNPPAARPPAGGPRNR